MGMESDILKNQLLNIRNILNTMAGNIDNTIHTYNNINRTNRINTQRRNINNIFNDLRNIYPEVNRSINNHLYNSTSTNTDSENSNNANSNNANSNNANTNADSENINSENSNNENNSNPTNMYHNLNFTYPSSIDRSNLFSNPELVEITLFNNERRVVNNLEDVPIYPSLRTLRDTSSISIYSEIDTEQETCSICRDRFESNSICRKLSCCHLFHQNCIDIWFETNIRCPLCRNDLRDNENIDTNPEN